MSDTELIERLHILEIRIDELERTINHMINVGDLVIVEQNLYGIGGSVNERKEYVVKNIIKGV